MKGTFRAAFSLIELLCVVAILGALLALMLPAFSKGKTKVQRVQCANNLRQVGIALQSFAALHEDKLPIQVSTNFGGSLEFLQAAYSVNGEFNFSYRHFTPLASDLRTPTLLACPADSRLPATNFAAFKNDHLSYFASANPRFGAADSILIGNRNITPLFGSLARVGSTMYLKWTEELHKFKGNVLFGDTHVEQLKDVLKLTNAPVTEITLLLMPSVKKETAPTAAPSTLGGLPGLVDAGSRPGNIAALRVTATNAAGGVNQYLTNISVAPPRPKAPLLVNGTPGGSSGPMEAPSTRAEDQVVASTNVSSAPAVIEKETAEEEQLAKTHESVVAAAKKLVSSGWRRTYGFPWLLLVVFLLALLELWRRARTRLAVTPTRKRRVPMAQSPVQRGKF